MSHSCSNETSKENEVLYVVTHGFDSAVFKENTVACEYVCSVINVERSLISHLLTEPILFVIDRETPDVIRLQGEDLREIDPGIFLNAERIDILSPLSGEISKIYLHKTQLFLENPLTKDGEPARVCSVCGKRMSSGWTDEWEFYACSEECLKKGMDSEGLPWEFTEEENEEGGYYQYINPDGTITPLNIFYTEW